MTVYCDVCSEPVRRGDYGNNAEKQGHDTCLAPVATSKHDGQEPSDD